MSRAIVFLTDGFEETEAIAPADILRRAGVNVVPVSVTGNAEVKGSHGIVVKADALLGDLAGDLAADGSGAGLAAGGAGAGAGAGSGSGLAADMLVLPGGAVVDSYMQCNELLDALVSQFKAGRHIAAICAAPLVLGKLGLLAGKTATCYPKLSSELEAKVCSGDAVVTDGNITTGRSAGVSVQFGLALAAILAGEAEAQRIKEALYI